MFNGERRNAIAQIHDARIRDEMNRIRLCRHNGGKHDVEFLGRPQYNWLYCQSRPTGAYFQIADIQRLRRDVRFVPLPEVASRLVGAGKQRRRDARPIAFAALRLMIKSNLVSR
jgi:hypothetical protein